MTSLSYGALASAPGELPRGVPRSAPREPLLPASARLDGVRPVRAAGATSGWAPAVSQVDGGDDAAYVAFVRTRGPALVRLARHLLRDPAQAEDVVQDVLATALLRWDRISAADDIDAYVRRMVVNACTSWFRRAARRERTADPTQLPQAAAAVDPYRQLDQRDELLRLLRRLPVKQRTVLVLRHLEGLDDDEIARVTGVREVTVRSNAHRGLATLRALLEDSSATVGRR